MLGLPTILDTKGLLRTSMAPKSHFHCMRLFTYVNSYFQDTNANVLV